MYGISKPLPIPECQSYKKSKKFWLLEFVGQIGQKFQTKTKKKRMENNEKEEAVVFVNQIKRYIPKK